MIVNERERSIVNRILKSAWTAFQHWYLHDNADAPDWWKRADPYKSWLEEYAPEQLIAKEERSE